MAFFGTIITVLQIIKEINHFYQLGTFLTTIDPDFLHFNVLECYESLTDISGQLVFERGPKPQETECKWTIQNPSGYQIVVNLQRYRDEYCG